MFLESALGIICGADIQRLVSAFEDVAEEHEECDLPLGKLGTKFSPGENFGGGGSRTPVRKALRPEAYMLSAFDLVRRLRLERARNAAD